MLLETNELILDKVKDLKKPEFKSVFKSDYYNGKKFKRFAYLRDRIKAAQYNRDQRKFATPILNLDRNISNRKSIANFFVRHYFPFIVLGAIVGLLAPIFAAGGIVAVFSAITTFNFIAATYITGTLAAWYANRFLFRKTKLLAKYEGQMKRRNKRILRQMKKYDKIKQVIQIKENNIKDIFNKYLGKNKNPNSIKLALKEYKTQKAQLFENIEKLNKKYKKIYGMVYGNPTVKRLFYNRATQGVFGKLVNAFANIFDLDADTSFNRAYLNYNKIADKIGKVDKINFYPRYKFNFDKFNYALYNAKLYTQNLMLNINDYDQLITQDLPEKKSFIKIANKLNLNNPKVVGAPLFKKTRKLQDKTNKLLTQKDVYFNAEEFESLIEKRNGVKKGDIFGEVQKRREEQLNRFYGRQTKQKFVFVEEKQEENENEEIINQESTSEKITRYILDKKPANAKKVKITEKDEQVNQQEIKVVKVHNEVIENKNFENVKPEKTIKYKQVKIAKIETSKQEKPEIIDETKTESVNEEVKQDEVIEQTKSNITDYENITEKEEISAVLKNESKVKKPRGSYGIYKDGFVRSKDQFFFVSPEDRDLLDKIKNLEENTDKIIKVNFVRDDNNYVAIKSVKAIPHDATPNVYKQAPYKLENLDKTSNDGKVL